MSGSFLFTRDTAGRIGGESNVQPLLRSGNNNVSTLNQAVNLAVQRGLVTVDGATVYMAADVAFMMIGKKSELRPEVASDNNMTYTQIRSAAPNTDLRLYHLKYEPSLIQTDHIYVLAGPQYWNNMYGPDLDRVDINDNNGRSWSLDLGSNAGNARDPRMIITHINELKN